jgi:hypothetical protein
MIYDLSIFGTIFSVRVGINQVKQDISKLVNYVAFQGE